MGLCPILPHVLGPSALREKQQGQVLFPHLCPPANAHPSALSALRLLSLPVSEANSSGSRDLCPTVLLHPAQALADGPSGALSCQT